jgi:hypothetical protein
MVKLTLSWNHSPAKCAIRLVQVVSEASPSPGFDDTSETRSHQMEITAGIQGNIWCTTIYKAIIDKKHILAIILIYIYIVILYIIYNILYIYIACSSRWYLSNKINPNPFPSHFFVQHAHRAGFCVRPLQIVCLCRKMRIPTRKKSTPGRGISSRPLKKNEERNLQYCGLPAE